MAKLIAQTYGQALVELAIEENKAPELLQEVIALKKLLEDEKDFMNFMLHPQVTKEEKSKVLEEVLKGRVSEEITGFLMLINDKDRYLHVDEIFDYFIAEMKKLQGIGAAVVSTPLPLSDEQKKTVEEKLLKTTGFKEIEIEYLVDESLIGGMIIRIGDRVVDSSVRSRLYDLKKNLMLN